MARTSPGTARGRGARLATTTHATEALVLRAVPYGEADVVVTLFTETLGRVAAIARRARDASAKRRTRVVVEPMHTLRVVLEERPHADLMVLKDSGPSVVRMRLTGRLDALDAAGRALRWLRELAPTHAPDPALWDDTIGLLDALDAVAPAQPPIATLAIAGLRFLDAAGYGLQLDACVRCGKPCPEGGAALLDPAAGGIVCRACGGGPVLVPGALRAKAVAAREGAASLDEREGVVVLEWVDRAIATHAGR